jgi:class 3 adenylate cyclase
MSSHFDVQTNPLTTGASVSVLDYVHASGAALKQLIDEHKTGYVACVQTKINSSCDTASVTFRPTVSKGADELPYRFIIPHNKTPMLVSFTLPGFIRADDRLSRVQADTWTGYWVHEALHVLYSDLRAIREHEEFARQDLYGAFSRAAAQRQGFALYRGLYNALEDVRIEYLAQRDGCVKNLSVCLSRLRNFSYTHSVEGRPPGVPENVLDLPENAAYTMKIVLNVQLLGLDLPRVVRDWTEATRMPGVLESYLTSMVDAPLTTQEAVHTASLQIAKDLIQLALDWAEPGDSQTDPPKSSRDGETGDGETGDGETGDGETGDGETGDGETGDGETGDGETGDGETGDGETGDGETGDGETGSKISRSDCDATDRSAFAALLTAEIPATDDTLEGLLKRNSTPRSHYNAPVEQFLLTLYEPMSRWTGKSISTNPDVRSLLPRTAQLENDLRYLVRAPDQSGIAGHKHRGRLQSRAIPRGIAGASDIFQRRWLNEGHNTAVLVIIDRSGSMSTSANVSGDTRQSVANALVSVIGDTLRRAGAPFAATAFNTDTSIIKTFTDPWDRTIKRRVMAVFPDGYTRADCAFVQSVQLFRQLSPSLKVTRRIVLFVVDGDNDSGPEIMQRLTPRLKMAYQIDGVYGLGIEREIMWGLDGAEKVDGRTIGAVGLKTIKRALIERK